MRKVLFGCFSFSLIVAIVFFLYTAPFRALDQIKIGLQTEDQALLEQYIHFENIRVSLKQQIQAEISSKTKNSFFKKVLTGLSSLALDKLSEKYLTPKGLIQLAKGGNPQKKENNSEKPKEPFEGQARYDSLDQFSIHVPNEDGKITQFILKREQLQWRLNDILLDFGEGK